MINLDQDSIESKNELLKAQHEQEFLESLNQIKTAKHHDENTDGFVEINHEGHGFTNRIENLSQCTHWYISEWPLNIRTIFAKVIFTNLNDTLFIWYRINCIVKKLLSKSCCRVS